MGIDLRSFIDTSVRGRCESRGFDEMTARAERHGSLEWVYGQKKSSQSTLNRFITVALTANSVRPPDWLVELWAGADDGQRFTRRPIGEMTIEDDEFFTNPARFEDRLLAAVSRAIEIATSFSSNDLSEGYLPPRHKAPLA